MKERSLFYRWGKNLNYKNLYGGRLRWYERLALRLWRRLYGQAIPTALRRRPDEVTVPPKERHAHYR